MTSVKPRGHNHVTPTSPSIERAWRKGNITVVAGCERCDKDRHTCKGCGASLRHNELRLDGTECDCA